MLALTQGMMSLDAGGGSGITFNPAQVSAPSVLSVGNLRLTANTGAAGDYANTRATRAVTGNCYFSAEVANFTSEDAGFGIAAESWTLSAAALFVGGGGESAGMYSTSGNVYASGFRGSGGTLGSVDSVQVAVRTASRRVWIRRNGGAWQGGGDPVADTTPTATIGGTGALFPAASLTRAGATPSRYVQLHPDAASTTGAVPVGFTAANWVP